jgi:hypothetical protein
VGDLLLTCAPLSKTIVVMVSRNVSRTTVRSLPHGHQSKWVFKLSMVWPHYHYERWATLRCGNPRWIHSAKNKWIDNKQNIDVVGQNAYP